MRDFYQTWRGGKVQRMHTMPQTVQENVAEHTWGILLAVLRFYPEATADFLKAVILHDIGEIATGDIPAHVKWSSTQLEDVCNELELKWLEESGLKFPGMTADESSLMLILDKLDFCMSCLHEMRLGNLNTITYYERSANKALKTFREMPDSREKQAADRILEEFMNLHARYIPPYFEVPNVFNSDRRR